jgi:hypothetical protein
MRRVYQPSLNPRTNAASQSDQEAGTSETVFITPSVAQHHQSAAKAWGLILASGAPFLVSNSSYNVASVSGPGNGVVVVNFTNHFSTSQIVPFGYLLNTSASRRDVYSSNLTSASFHIFVDNAGTLVTSWNALSFVVYGDL